MNDLIQDVKQFHETFGHPVVPSPQIPPPDRQSLRAKLIREEYIEEFDPAWVKCAQLQKDADPNNKSFPPHKEEIIDALAEFGDAIADVIYYLIGTAHEYGIPLDRIWAAVQQANMSKLWTEEEIEAGIPEGWIVRFPPTYANASIVTDETGKVRKPPSWKEPDIKGIIREAMKGQPCKES